MRKILLLHLLFLLISKTHFAQHKATSITQDISEPSHYSALRKSEVLSISDIKINGRLGLFCTARDLQKVLKRPGKVEISTMECGGYYDELDVYIHQYGGSWFEVWRDTVVLRTVDFRDGRLFVVAPKITLSKHTTLEEIKRVFPAACENISQREHEHTGATVEEISLQDHGLSDSWWNLTFQNGMLIELHYFIPC